MAATTRATHGSAFTVSVDLLRSLLQGHSLQTASARSRVSVTLKRLVATSEETIID